VSVTVVYIRSYAPIIEAHFHFCEPARDNATTGIDESFHKRKETTTTTDMMIHIFLKKKQK
jgi:hypothetical protein